MGEKALTVKGATLTEIHKANISKGLKRYYGKPESIEQLRERMKDVPRINGKYVSLDGPPQEPDPPEDPIVMAQSCLRQLQEPSPEVSDMMDELYHDTQQLRHDVVVLQRTVAHLVSQLRPKAFKRMYRSK